MTNLEVLNEFVKKTFGFSLDEALLQENVNGMVMTCLVDPKLCKGDTCQGCQYNNFWNREYKEDGMDNKQDALHEAMKMFVSHIRPDGNISIFSMEERARLKELMLGGKTK